MAQIGVRKGNIRKISVSISEDSADWLETQVESQNYRSISHAVDSVIRNAKRTNEAKAAL
jgi:Arc/MetJ-type ribon-helix-helix transcriptional regulator